ncbi:MAG TPA: DUF3293 domain-containing protein [Gemmatimonadales bacterium]
MTRAPESADPRWATYPDTIVEIFTSPLLRVDLRHPLPTDLATRLRGLGLGDAWSVITAHNPGRMLSESENERRERDLWRRAESSGAAFLRADGVNPDGTDREVGVAIALAREGSIALAAEFGQSATFWFDGACFWLDPALVGDRPIRLPA